MSRVGRATRLHRQIAAFDGELDAPQAARVLRAVSAFGWYELRNPMPQRDRAGMHRARRLDRAWQCELCGSGAFARCYAALPAPKLPAARALLIELRRLRGAIELHDRGQLDPHEYARMFDPGHDPAAELRRLALSVPTVQRAAIEQAAQRIEHDDTWYFDPFGGTAPPELIGERGRAGDPSSAFRGWMVRSVARLVPESTADRFACIAELLRRCGMPTRSDEVRATLQSWKQKRR